MGLPANSYASDEQLKFLIYRCTDWIGGLLGKLFEAQNIPFVYGFGRLENRSDITTANPSHVFNATGVTGWPNMDWCESHKVETIRTNVVGTFTLADVCYEKGLILINYTTGCIFEYDSTPWDPASASRRRTLPTSSAPSTRRHGGRSAAEL